MKAYIKYFANYLPEKVLTNYDLEKTLDTNNEWIVSRTGIEQRRIAEDETISEMAVNAVKKLIEKCENIEDTDVIIVATSTKDYIFPSTAGIIQKEFNIQKKCMSIDISVACSGYVYALNTAATMIESSEAKKVLIVAAEKYSNIVNWDDRSTAIIFGDGVNVTMVEATEDNSKGIIAMDIGASGNDNILLVKSGGSASPIDDKNIEENSHKVYMDGTEVFKNAVPTFKNTMLKTIKEAGLTLDDINLIITHQANTRIVKAISKELNVPIEKFFVNIQKYGNTSAASIGIALTEAFDEGKIKEGDHVLLSGFGGGLTWGSTLIRF